MCFNFSTHDGCAEGDHCVFPHAQRVRPEGLRWAIQYDLARRGGLLTGGRIGPKSSGGYVQAMRSHNDADSRKVIDAIGRNVGRRAPASTDFMVQPPGLYRTVVDSATCSTLCSEGINKKVERWTRSQANQDPLGMYEGRNTLGVAGGKESVQMQSRKKGEMGRSIWQPECDINGMSLVLEKDGVAETGEGEGEEGSGPTNITRDEEVEEENDESSTATATQDREEHLMAESKNEPAISEEEEYRKKRREYNPGVDRIPRDCFRFAPTEMETLLSELLRATDRWAYIQEKDGEEW